jgi:hypothetical protein
MKRRLHTPPTGSSSPFAVDTRRAPHVVGGVEGGVDAGLTCAAAGAASAAGAWTRVAGCAVRAAGAAKKPAKLEIDDGILKQLRELVRAGPGAGYNIRSKDDALC